MQKFISTNALERVKTALTADKQYKPDKFTDIIRAEIYNILIEYADIKPDDFEVCINKNDFGDYTINISALARRLKVIGIVPDKCNGC